MHPIRKVGSCSLGREALRQPADLVAGPDGKTLYSVGFLHSDYRGIALVRLSGGAPKPVSGPTGCFLDGSIYAREKTPCNKSFALGALAEAEQTFTLSPDGRSAYVLDQVPASDFVRLILLARTR